MATKSNFMGYTRGVPVFSDSNEIISTNPLYISFVGTSKTLNARSPVPMVLVDSSFNELGTVSNKLYVRSN